MWQSDSPPAQAPDTAADRSGPGARAAARDTLPPDRPLRSGPRPPRSSCWCPRHSSSPASPPGCATSPRRLARGRWFPTVALYGAAYAIVQAIAVPAVRVVRRLRAAARVRALRPRPRGVARRLGARAPAIRPLVIAAAALDPLPAAAREPAALVALERPARRPAHRARDDRGAGVDRAALRPIRPDARRAARGADPRSRGPGGDRGQPDLRGAEERRHPAGQRVRHRLRRHQADRAVGHPGRPARARRGGVRDGARDGALRPAPHAHDYTWGHRSWSRCRCTRCIAVAGWALARFRRRFGFEPAGRRRLAAAARAGRRRGDAGDDAGRAGAVALAGARGRPLRPGDHAATTRRPRAPSSGSTTRTSPSRAPGSSTGCGAAAIRIWPTGSSSPTTTAPGPRGEPLRYGDRFRPPEPPAPGP